jgi:hypothetical protein
MDVKEFFNTEDFKTWYRGRLSIRQGVTLWWAVSQVTNFTGTLTADDMERVVV